MKFIITFIIGVICLAGCASKPQTRYYSLLAPAENLAQTSHDLEDVSLGIGTVKLPSMLDRKGIVTSKGGPSVQVASHDVWAGDLQENITLVVADLLARQLRLDEVYVAPWNTRFRPEFQVQLEIRQMSGQLGGSAVFRANWILSGDKGREKLIGRSSEIELNSTGSSYEAYVSTLNRLLIEFVSKELGPSTAEGIAKQLSKAK